MFPQEFIQLLHESVPQADSVLAALGQNASVSIRLNPSKLRECPFSDASPVPWSPYGYLLPQRPVFTLDPLLHAGAYYVQDSSAMFAGHVFRQLPLAPGAAVLDLCAAPGGKTTDLAASLRERLGGDFTLLSNEVMRSRLGALSANVESWGDPRVGVISRDPSSFGSEGVFDVILADVPCSGEGMFRKDPQALAEWSPENVQFCAARSRRILRDVWPALKPGGYLIYATCTFNHLENDDTVAWIAEELGAASLELPDMPPVVKTRLGMALLPGLVPGEGQYVAALRKNGSATIQNRSGNLFSLFGARIPAAPIPEDLPRWNLDRSRALHYLHGDALVLEADAPLGMITLCYRDLPLGTGKNLGKRCNNLYPKAKRIRMDIPQ